MWLWKKDLSHYRFTLDYIEDYHFIKCVFEKLYPINPLFQLQDIITLLKKNPDLLKLNANRVDTTIVKEII